MSNVNFSNDRQEALYQARMIVQHTLNGLHPLRSTTCGECERITWSDWHLKQARDALTGALGRIDKALAEFAAHEEERKTHADQR